MMKRYFLNGIGIVLAVAFVVFLIIFNINLEYPLPADAQTGNKYEKAKVVRIVSDTLAPDPEFKDIKIGVQELEFEILTGEHKGKNFIGKNFISRTMNYPAKVGTKMVISSYDGFISGLVVGYSRGNVLYILGIVFAIAVLIIGFKKGLKSLMALVFTLICIIFLFTPMLIRGINPIVAALIVVSLSTIATMLALNGWSRKTVVAIISCLLCTLLAGGISILFGALAHISTYATPEIEDLVFIAQNTSLKLHDILFAGIIIAASGAVMDTTISVVSSMFEMREIDPEISQKKLFKSGMNVGRDIMGANTNTLILAFTGSSINTILVVFMYQLPYMQMINLDLLAIEVVRGLSGAIAVVLSIPITAMLVVKSMKDKR